jgi:hypothetical protein
MKLLQDDRMTYDKSFSNLNELHLTSSTPSSSIVNTLSRPNSVSSLTGLDIPEPHDEISGPIATFIDVLKGGGNVRTSSPLNLLVLFLLLFVTIGDGTFRSSSNNTKSTIYTYNDDYSDPNSKGSKEQQSPQQQQQQQQQQQHHSNKVKKGLLGPAMIQSVTEALSPILPFAGGVDLRRDEHWKSWESWLQLWDVVFSKQDQFIPSSSSPSSIHSSGEEFIDHIIATPRGGGVGGSKTNNHQNKRAFNMKKVLSASDPFLSTSDISAMTLQEISVIFQYAIKSGEETIDTTTFLKQKFHPEVNMKRITKAVDALENATAMSRGHQVISSITSHTKSTSNQGPLSDNNGYGDVDALKFCAAMRIFAEWRVLRQVPPGYKGYAVGMNLGHKDVVQNIVKIESAIHDWIETRPESEDGNQTRSPTLRELLQHETDIDVHPNHKLPRLKDKSAAMGLLWVRRQLQYQTAVFTNIISVPDVYPTIIDAVGSAYTEIYGQLHGWTVQKIFNYSFQSAPDTDLIFRHMNPRKLKEVGQNGKNKKNNIVDQVSLQGSSIESVVETTIEANNDDTTIQENDCDQNENNNIFTKIGSECDKFFSHIGSELGKMCNEIGTNLDNIMLTLSNVFQNDKNTECEINQKVNTRGGASFNDSVNRESAKNGNDVSSEELEAFISEEMAIDARDHILMYLNAVVPLLNDLSGLFEEMNMDDPTKV